MGTESGTTPKSQRAFIFSLIIAVATAILNTLTASGNWIENGSKFPGSSSDGSANIVAQTSPRVANTLERIEGKIDNLQDRVRLLEKEVRK